MQATRQNTRQLAAGASEIMEWYTQGAEWSVLNYGPGILWFSYTPGVDAAPGEVQSTKLEPAFSFTDSASAPRFLQLSLYAEAGNVTYSLNTNQRYGAGLLPPGSGIEEAPEDGGLYGRQNADWIPVAPEAPIDPNVYGRRGGDQVWIQVPTDLAPKVNRAGDSMTGNLFIDNGRVEIVRPTGQPTAWNMQSLILAHAAPGYNQSVIPGAIAIVFMNNNTPGNGGFRIGKVVLSDSADEFIFQAGTNEGVIDARGRNFSATAQPTTPEHLTRRDYVDAAAAGPIQTMTVTGSGWAGGINPTLRYRHLNNQNLVHMVGQLGRAGPGENFPPGTPGIILGQLPPGYRPIVAVGTQFELCACTAGLAADSPPHTLIEYGFLTLDQSGNLTFYGHAPLDLNAVPPLQGTSSIYIDNIFSLT